MKESGKKSPTFFAFFLLLPAAVRLRGDVSTLSQLSCTTCDIKTFFDTDEAIWTFRSTERLKLECKVDVKLKNTDTFVLFERHFYLKGNRVNVTINGTFASLADPRIISGKYDTILLAYPDMWLEIRVRNSTVDKPEKTCVESFRQSLPKLKGKRRLVYKHECQRILPQINE
nr:uncharacterized protein LOC126534032 isoform X2 [Dermacentor andersoni]